MKKIVLLVAILAIAFAHAVSANAEYQVDTTVFFGQYEQDNNTNNGTEPIEWLVLDVEDGKALLLSKYALDCQPYNTPKTDTTWANSSLRVWLMNTFYESAFTAEEKTAVVSTTNANNDGNTEWTTDGGIETIDKIFVPSYAEVAKYFSAQGARKLTGTEYARSLGAKYLGFTTLVIGETDWWLRSPGKVQSDVCYIDVHGNFATKQVSDKVGIRPMLWVDTNADQSKFPYVLYINAVSLNNAGSYLEAAEVFAGLNNYYNSDANATECLYLQAAVHAETGEYDQAIALYESLGDYKESYTLCRTARYNEAVSFQEVGNFDQAIKMFGEVGQYNDSMARLKACFDEKGISVFYFSQEAKNTGVDNGYSKPSDIGGSDKHFGWRLGRFFVSGFTRVTDNTSDNPVFIKTLGDSITLWFDLEQNIDSLNGNSMLIIDEDVNGYDQKMGVQKTNFGRGTLIIRHTDYQNSKGDPVIYTDYVLAKGTTAADTKVILAEEGDYEVVLDYELQDNDLMHSFDKYGNYQIAFTFSVRNGNCMVYPFDIATGAELQNTSVVEEGFYLDLARSRYLDIDVKRTELVETIAGIVEDERFNRPAKDGDKYTAEGIYTISVSNCYTGEHTTKTIFVGSDELLQQYIANGFSMDRLK